MEARLQLHWAAQVLSATASALIPEESDDRHSNLEWDGGPDGVLLTRVLFDSDRWGEVDLALDAGRLLVHICGEGDSLSEVALGGRSVQTALEAVRRDLVQRAPEEVPDLLLRGYEMPSHPLGEGATFDVGSDAQVTARMALAHWFSRFTQVFRVVEESLGERLVTGAHLAEARIWPHHFDLGGLLTLERAGRDPATGYVGYGLSPGDTSHPMPYLYVTPYPASAFDSSTVAAPLRWETDAFQGIRVDAVDLVECSEVEQCAVVERAVMAALEAVAG